MWVFKNAGLRWYVNGAQGDGNSRHTRAVQEVPSPAEAKVLAPTASNEQPTQHGARDCVRVQVQKGGYDRRETETGTKGHLSTGHVKGPASGAPSRGSCPCRPRTTAHRLSARSAPLLQVGTTLFGAPLPAQSRGREQRAVSDGVFLVCVCPAPAELAGTREGLGECSINERTMTEPAVPWSHACSIPKSINSYSAQHHNSVTMQSTFT